MQLYSPINNPLIQYQFPEIKEIISNGVESIDYYKRYDIIDEYRATCKKWLQEGTDTKIKGLDSFPYVYAINGVSQYINDLPKIEHRTIVKHVHEYSGYASILELYNRPARTELSYDTMDNKKNDEVIVVSYPVSLNGNKDTTVEQLIKNSNTPIILDGVFLGANLFEIDLDISNVESFAFSFSKSFGLAYNRIGILFTKTVIEEYEQYHEHGYQNIYGMLLALEIMKKYNLDYFTNKYRNIYEEACKRKGLLTGDCILIGNATHTNANKKELVTDIFDKVIHDSKFNDYGIDLPWSDKAI